MSKIVNFFLDAIISIKSFISVMIFSVMLIVIGSIICTFCNDPAYNRTKDWIVSRGTISEITDKVAYCDHEVDGFTYEHCKLDSYYEGFQVGGSLRIKYNPVDPYEITCLNDDKSLLVGIYVCCFVVAAAIPVGYFGVGYYRYAQRKKAEKQFEQPNEDK